MISFQCGACGQDIKVKDELAGRRGKCPRCQQPVTVPASASPVAKDVSRHPAPGDQRDAPTLLPSGALAGNPREADTIPPRSQSAAVRTDAGIPGAPSDVAPENYDFLAPAQEPDEMGRLGEYRILKVLGAGGMGVVFLAEDPKLKRKLAIKAMLPSMAASSTAKQRFLREAQTAAAIEHDNIVTIHQVSEDRGVPFIAMPFLKGEPLDARLEREGTLPVAEIVRIGREAAKGLAAAHAAGLVHRDIKPANLWLEGEDRRVKILDFGLARAAADKANLTQQGAIIGTPAYMAPEQAKGEAIDARSDLFSLGCVLYRMCTGRAPFKDADPVSTLVSVAMDNPSTVAELRPDLPRALSNLVMQLLSKKPEDRPQLAKAVAEALRAIDVTKVEPPVRPREAQRKVPSEAAPRTEVVRKPARRTRKRGAPWPWLIAGGVVGVGALVVALVLLLRTPNGTEHVENDPNHDGPRSTGVADNRTPPTSVLPGPPTTFKNSIGMEFVQVPKGRAWLGGIKDDPPDKEVAMLDDFFLGKYEVTQEEWQKVMGYNPSCQSRTGHFKDKVKDISDADLKRFPVESVSEGDMLRFLKGLNEHEDEKAWVYRLPTAVEWEYACRGGPMAGPSEGEFDFYFEKPTNQLLPDQAVFGRQPITAKVGGRKPNRLGLYDMHGNVWERCQGGAHGGSFLDPPDDCRATSTIQAQSGNNVGFRVARVPLAMKAPHIRSLEPKKPDAVPGFTNSLGMEFVVVPRGKSWLVGGGGRPGDKEVAFANDIYLGKYVVTQEEWQKVMGINPSFFKGEHLPVENVSWDACQLFLKKLNERTREPGWTYRLPTEEEWEYACRGGPMTDKAESAFDFYFDRPTNELSLTQANFGGQKGLGGKRTTIVWRYKPNRLGLYDMHGNVWQWCVDGVPGPDRKLRRVRRGGSWVYDAAACRAASRDLYPQLAANGDLGLRVARVPVAKDGE
jgi:formylglycine-generating enzyme required for sulfatase activity/serine/threonine protein kinase